MRSLPAALCCLLLCAWPAQAADEWLGRKVFCRPGSVAKVGETEIAIDNVPFPATVSAVNGDWLWLGRAWVRKADALSADQALAVVSAQLRQSPKIAQLWICRGAIWREKGDYPAALKDFSEAIRLDPKQPAAFNNRGNALSHEGQFEAAIKDFNEAIRLDPKFTSAYANRGIVWSRTGDFPKAIDDFGKAIALDPKDPTVFENRGSAFGVMGEPDRAIEDLSEAIRLDATAGLAFFNRGNAQRAKGDLDRAIKDYTQAIKIDPTDAQALVARGGVWAAQGKLQEALDDYAAALRLDPKMIEAFNARAWLRATSAEEKYRDGSQAVDDATRACQLAEWQDWTTLDTLAAAYAEQGDFGQAVSWAEKALELAKATKDGAPVDSAGIESRLALYQTGKPYREEPPVH